MASLSNLKFNRIFNLERGHKGQFAWEQKNTKMAAILESGVLLSCDEHYFAIRSSKCMIELMFSRSVNYVGEFKERFYISLVMVFIKRDDAGECVNDSGEIRFFFFIVVTNRRVFLLCDFIGSR